MVFEASARHLNFSKAAEELSITQPAVSHGIRQLEASLAQLLFVRERRALKLTSHGQRLFASVSGSLTAIADTVDEISGAPQRNVVVVSTSTVMANEWLLPRLPLLREHDPTLIIDLRCTDRDPDLTADGIDLHIRIGDGNWPGYETSRLWRETINCICSPEYLQRYGPITLPSDLLEHRLVHYVDAHRYRLGWGEWFRASGISVPLSLPTTLKVNDSLLALRASENGEGISLGTRPVIDRSLASGLTVLAHPNVVTTGRYFYSVSVYNSSRRRHIALFRDWLTEQVRQFDENQLPTKAGDRMDSQEH
ncbi:LysR substrate-binding domain-containing protein [Mesorhizobium kowhaii]|uniref:LysR substrate-binding domain-containing protein n=1 Tax=Mesorhizobium kowhaii TaxID=1300272 RepID=UPI0035EB6DF7